MVFDKDRIENHNSVMKVQMKESSDQIKWIRELI